MSNTFLTVESTYIFGFRGLHCAFEVRCLGVIMRLYPRVVVKAHMQRIAGVIGDRLNVSPCDECQSTENRAVQAIVHT